MNKFQSRIYDLISNPHLNIKIKANSRKLECCCILYWISACKLYPWLRLTIYGWKKQTLLVCIFLSKFSANKSFQESKVCCFFRTLQSKSAWFQLTSGHSTDTLLPKLCNTLWFKVSNQKYQHRLSLLQYSTIKTLWLNKCYLRPIFLQRLNARP